jgi:hypothetical protein
MRESASPSARSRGNLGCTGTAAPATFLKIASLTIFLTLAAVAQNPSLPASSPPSANDLSFKVEDLEKNAWSNAKPYVDYALKDLMAALPELQGMQPAESQLELPSILDRVGENCIDLLRRTPNVISHEDVTTRERIISVISQGGTDLRPLAAKP